MLRRWLVALSLAPAALACTCVSLTVCDLIQRDVLFIGEVIEGGVEPQEDPWHAQSHAVTFRVVQAFRGIKPGAKTVQMDAVFLGGMCMPNPYHRGGSYLVAPVRRQGGFADGMCTASRSIHSDPGLIAAIRDHFAGRPVGVIGHAAIAEDAESVEYLLSAKETKAAAGATVTAERAGQRKNTTVDPLGAFRIPALSPGTYRLTLSLDPYETVFEDVTVPRDGCILHDSAFDSGSQISGRILDASGTPVPGVAALVPVDPPRDSAVEQPWMDDAHVEPREGNRFVFRNVPVGRYLLMSNPDGRQPFESTFYPDASTRAEAKEILVDSPLTVLSGMDLRVGKPVAMRDVTVRAKLPDGNLWPAAAIRLVGQPTEPGGLHWRGWGDGFKGETRFRAPANRKLRVEVIDSYGRKLSREYVAEFEPGVWPIIHEFTVEP
ncbi:MAG: carboxypeptidase-like regulatory domain-containing protein [Bryobacteraceae bacterium]